MSLDAKKSELTNFGKITINAGTSLSPSLIEIEGFDGEGCTCRDVSVLACIWAIGVLQQEILISVQQPGLSNSVIVD